MICGSKGIPWAMTLHSATTKRTATQFLLYPLLLGRTVEKNPIYLQCMASFAPKPSITILCPSLPLYARCDSKQGVKNTWSVYPHQRHRPKLFLFSRSPTTKIHVFCLLLLELWFDKSIEIPAVSGLFPSERLHQGGYVLVYLLVRGVIQGYYKQFCCLSLSTWVTIRSCPFSLKTAYGKGMYRLTAVFYIR